MFLVVLQTLKEETLEDGSRTVLNYHHGIVPTKAAVLPLVKKKMVCLILLIKSLKT
jgi:glycyl-tRNA synthetase (class II)